MGEINLMGQAINVSVVTVCYNEAEMISATLQSVAEQTYNAIEHIVQDGGSSDGTVEVVRQYAGGHANVVIDSAKDGGIYYGMNAALSKCGGDYVIFCNGGDRFASNNVVAELVAKAMAEEMPDLVYGDCASEVNGQMMVRTAHGPGFMKIGMPAAHEAMLYKLSLLREKNIIYDTSYRITADYKFTYEFVKAAKTFAYVPIPIVIFDNGGVSTTSRWRAMLESSRVRKEVGGLPFSPRFGIILMISGVFLFSTFLGPVYRLIRLRKIK